MNRRTVRKAEALNGQKYIYKKTNKLTYKRSETNKETNKKNKTKQNKSRIEPSQESIPAHPVR